MADYIEHELLTQVQHRVWKKTLSTVQSAPAAIEKILHKLSEVDVSTHVQSKCDLLLRLISCSKIGDERAIMACINHLSDTQTVVKLRALEALHAIVPIGKAFKGRQQLIDAISKILIDFNARVREMAMELLLTLLVDHRDKDTLSSVTFSLNEIEEFEVPRYARVSSLLTLSNLATKGDLSARKALKGDARAQRAVMTGLRSSDSLVRKAAIVSLKSLSGKDDTQVLESVLHLLYDDQDEIRCAVLELLQELSSPGNSLVISHLCNYITSESRNKSAATKALISIAPKGDLDTLRCLILGLDDKDPAVRAQSAFGLECVANTGDQISIYALLLKLNREKVKGILFLLDPHSLGKEHASSRELSTITDRDLPKLVVGRFLGEKTDAPVSSPQSAVTSPSYNPYTGVAMLLYNQNSVKRNQDELVSEEIVQLSRDTPERSRSRLPSDNLKLDQSFLAEGAKVERTPYSVPSIAGGKLGTIRAKVWEKTTVRGNDVKQQRSHPTDHPPKGREILHLTRTRSKLLLVPHAHHAPDRSNTPPNMDNDCFVRQAVISALQCITCPGNVTVLDILIERLSDNEDIVRASTLAALDKLCSPQAIVNASSESDAKKGMELLINLRMQLMRLLEDKNGKIKSTCLELLKKICNAGDMAVATKIISCIHSLNHVEAISVLKFLVRNEKGNKPVIRCILACMTREYKLKQNSQEFRTLLEFLVEMTHRGDRQVIVGLADMMRDSQSFQERKPWCFQIVQKIAQRKDNLLIRCLLGDELSIPTELLTEIERHRSALSNLALEAATAYRDVP